MKEKYIFFILLIIAIVILLGSSVGKGAKGELSAREQAIEQKLQRAAQRQLIRPGKISIEKIENLVVFSYYEPLLERSPFFRVKPGRTTEGKLIPEVVPAVEEMTPLFLYKGKIVAEDRLVIIIEQTRSGETFMVSQGESIDGYKVLDITDTEVILSKIGEEDIVLKTTERP